MSDTHDTPPMVSNPPPQVVCDVYANYVNNRRLFNMQIFHALRQDGNFARLSHREYTGIAVSIAPSGDLQLDIFPIPDDTAIVVMPKTRWETHPPKSVRHPLEAFLYIDGQGRTVLVAQFQFPNQTRPDNFTSMQFRVGPNSDASITSLIRLA